MFQILLINNLYYLVIKMSKISREKHLGKVLMRDPLTPSSDICGIASEIFYNDSQVLLKRADLKLAIEYYDTYIKEPRCELLSYEVILVEKYKGPDKSNQSSLYAIYKHEGKKQVVSSPHFFYKKSLMFIDINSIVYSEENNVSISLLDSIFHNGRELTHEECKQLYNLQVPESLKF